MKRRMILAPDEQSVEAEIDKYVPAKASTRARVERVLERARKARNVNIRLSEHDLIALKEAAQREGLPYQTLLASILHKYVTNRLVDQESIMKTLELLEGGARPRRS